MATSETERYYEEQSGEMEGGEQNGVVAQLSAMFPNLEWELLQCVSRMHGSSVELAANYLMAVMGEEGDVMEHVFSEDIGGLPEVLSDSGSLSSSGEERTAVCVYLTHSDSDRESNEEELPSYDDAMRTAKPPPPPPSYSSVPGQHTQQLRVSAGASGGSVRLVPPTGQGVCSKPRRKQKKLSHKLRAQKIKKMGYKKGQHLLED